MDMTNLGITEALGIAALGITIVFLVLVFLMVIINIQNIVLSKLEAAKKAKEAPAASNEIPKAPAPAAVPARLAKGSCGGVMLHDVPDATAAMIMAIVADELQTPLNELRFISIQEVK